VVVAAKVKHAVDDRLGQVLRVLGADHDVAELARTERLARLVDRERQHVGGAVDAAMLAVEALDLAGVDERYGQVPVGYAGRLERGAGGSLVLQRPVYLDLGGQACRR
jgi:hypothetical protein